MSASEWSESDSDESFYERRNIWSDPGFSDEEKESITSKEPILFAFEPSRKERMVENPEKGPEKQWNTGDDEQHRLGNTKW